jgi:hypothetical protein
MSPLLSPSAVGAHSSGASLAIPPQSASTPTPTIAPRGLRVAAESPFPVSRTPPPRLDPLLVPSSGNNHLGAPNAAPSTNQSFATGGGRLKAPLR